MVLWDVLVEVERELRKAEDREEKRVGEKKTEERFEGVMARGV